ncbi:MAG: hypothetical protein AAF682_12545 [Planctomycetota bacterium]
MKRMLAGLAVVATAALGSPAAADVGGTPPEMVAVKWYNTPPLALEQLRGKAILVEVFRTW